MAAATSAAARAPKAGKPSTPDRARFALSGPSRPLDLKHNAARRDLADIRLAGRWFAPHYAEPEYWSAKQAVLLRDASSANAATIDTIMFGESFAVLELSGDWAWGFRVSDGLVGYVRVAELAPAGAPTA